MNEVRVYVDRDFKRRLKQMAVERNISLIKLTKEMSKDDMFAEKIKKKDGRTYKFNI